MRVTSLKAQIKNPERVSVHVDEKYAFSLNHAELLEQRLRIGLELTKDDLERLQRISNLGKMYERLLNLVMIRPRSRRELEQYGQRKKWPVEDTQAVIERLEMRGYVNDQNFARAWVDSRARTKPISERRLRLELRQKGVADETVNEVLSASEFNETHALAEMIRKKRRLARYQDDQKLMQYLARQGFSFDDIKTALRED